MRIAADQLWLRPISKTDIEKLRNWRNSYKGVYFDTTDITPEKQEKWFNKYISLPPGTDMMFVITLNNGQEIGTIALYDVSMTERSGVVGRVLVLEKHRGHGYAQEAVSALCDFAFNTMRLHRLVVETDLTNDNAIAIYHRTGFRIIGMRYIQTSKTNLYRLIVIMESVNPDHDTNKPVRLVNLD